VLERQRERERERERRFHNRPVSTSVLNTGSGDMQVQLTPSIYNLLITNHMLTAGGKTSKQNHSIKIINP